MAFTRSSTGHSKPRIQLNISTEPERRRTAKTTTTTTSRRHGHMTAQPATHHHRKPHLKDKIQGAAKKLNGTLTRRPGKKAAGTRQMRGTDGKGSRAKRI
ncbi:uncharacterized protein GGS22DRAFT_2804 [Annulohypoxylon maeteangense]|uniref:uncharacterized protein n=1 Tax=Annulohypoxylon maeteangense TaxID=1927788 RepID=UPI0020075DEC|nr:uncharacterized protein GGS22DRAFT_2804 [Annulohypoxylon maeteangense]KAI0889698.1 hypothetical protein GGS22DRAFT_2804 [Annulohypoxylon maeteangense]